MNSTFFAVVRVSPTDGTSAAGDLVVSATWTLLALARDEAVLRACGTSGSLRTVTELCASNGAGFPFRTGLAGAFACCSCFGAVRLRRARQT